MKKIILTVSLIIACFSANAADESVASSKALGAEVSGLLRGINPKDAASLQNSLEDFKSTTGLQDVNQLLSPGRKGREGLARISASNGVNFSCSPLAPQVLSAGLLSFKPISCNTASGAVVSASIIYCDNALSASSCLAENFNQDSQDPNIKNKIITVLNGEFKQVAKGSIGLGCDPSGLCRVTFNSEVSVGGSDAKMNSAAASVADGSSIARDLNGIVASGAYGTKMQEIAEPIINAQASGTSTSTDNGTCVQSPRVCIKKATLSNTYTRTCTRTLPLTEQISKYSFKDSTATCVETHSSSAGGQPIVTNSCSADQIKDMSKVGEEPKVCDSSSCADYRVTQYYANTSLAAATLLDQQASPSRVMGACDTTSDSIVTTCDGNNWFGRTEDPVNCYANMLDENNQPIAQATDIDFANKEGCGFCLTPVIGKTCYGTGTPSEAELDGGADSNDSCEVLASNPSCSFVRSEPIEGGTIGSLVSSQTEVYSCTDSTETCTEYSAQNSCIKADTFGLEQGGTGGVNYGTMANAMVAAAILDSTANGSEGTQNAKVPLVFTGSAMSCDRAVGGIGQLFGRNCCKTSLERPIAGFLTREGCSLDNAKLAAARRSAYATYVGDYCSKKMRFPSRCIRRTQSYCVFPGILPRVIQEQGRAQLARIVNSSIGASAISGNLVYSFYDATEQGRWSTPVSVNGSRVSAWQWPSYCADPAKAEEQLVNNPNAKECPGALTTVMAVCSSGESCGNLPAEPSEGSVSWELTEINPLENTTAALSRYVVGSGACNTSSATCTYSLAAYPAGQGGKAIVSKDLVFTLYQSAESDATTGLSASDYQMNNVGDLMFKGYSTTPSGSTSMLPATVRVDLSRDGGQSWQTLNLSTTSLKSSESLIGGTDVRVTGHCDLATNSCAFRFTGSVSVSAKPFGNPKYPDCSGFTAGQLSVLDFGKMDLSEWLNSVMSKVKGDSGAMVASTAAKNAAQQFASFNQLFSEGKVRSSSPVSANIARAVPSEGFGPFSVKLVVGGIWPEVTGDPDLDIDEISRVDVEWGDCSAKTTLPRVPGNSGIGFSAIHQYNAPDKHACLGNPRKNVTHEIKLTIYTSKSGIQYKSLYVENAWSVFPGGNSNNLNINRVKELERSQ